MNKMLFVVFFLVNSSFLVELPIPSNHIELTKIGQFGVKRKARPRVPAHLHTGVDIKRANGDYDHAPILAIADGEVISIRRDAAYAQIIINHDEQFWTLYEHVADIEVHLGDWVEAGEPVARFFNREELDRFGWQFDHFHFEVLKRAPRPLRYDVNNSERKFSSFTLECFNEEQLKYYFYDPLEFLGVH
ncbi:M23 family metallopeptidase [Reichenbachiella versicolor]|uniref:M23 family metallopeptidase n=1 Tax=Reichenbachiella versicolor TaxID=1821036 RepID=UPI000D6E7E58|nr:M23 family metallopeptidase [Reichenbachiella versicolor]